MNTFIIILIFLILVTIIQIFDIEVESLPECIIVRYTNPINRVRHERIIPTKAS